MKRQTFIEIIADIQAQQRKANEISQALGDITDEESVVYISQLVTRLVITLETEFDDDDQTISWWLWDAPHAGEVPEGCYIIDEKRQVTLYLVLSAAMKNATHLCQLLA